MKLSQKQLESLLQNPILDQKGKNLYSTCPFCGGDEFGISLDDNHTFNCFRKAQCGKTGTIYTLLKHLGRLVEFVSEREVDVFAKLENAFGKKEEAIEEVLPEITPPALWR